MIRVVSEVEIYEFNGQEIAIGAGRRVVTVCGHHIFDDRVVLQFDGKGESYTVIAKDLHAAIDNATHTAKR